MSGNMNQQVLGASPQKVNSALAEGRTLEPQLQAIVEHLRDSAQNVNYKGHSGFFFNRGELEKAEELVAFANSGKIQMLPEDQRRQYKDELVDMRKEMDVAKSAMTSIKEELSVAKTELREQEARANTELSLKTSKNQLTEMQKKQLQDKLTVAQAQNESMKRQLRQAKSGKGDIDVETAEQMAAHSSAEVTDLNNKLQSANNDLKRANDIVAVEVERSKALRDHVKYLESQMNDFNAAEAAAISLKPLKPAKVEINQNFLLKVLGSKGVEWLQKEELLNRTDTRERAYHLMQAANAGNTRIYKSLGSVLHIAWDTMKRLSRKTYSQFMGWLDEVTRDFRAGTLKSMKYYREKLEALISSLKAKAVVLKEKVKKAKDDSGAKSYWEWLGKGLRSRFSRFSWWPKGWFSSKWDAFKESGKKSWAYLQDLFSRRGRGHARKASKPPGGTYAEIAQAKNSPPITLFDAEQEKGLVSSPTRQTRGTKGKDVAKYDESDSDGEKLAGASLL